LLKLIKGSSEEGQGSLSAYKPKPDVRQL
jgi:hypothetical protein